MQTGTVIPITSASTNEPYSEKYLESTVQMICVNSHLWRREHRQLASSPGQLTEFWVKGNTMQVRVQDYRPQDYDNQCFELIEKFDLLGENLKTFTMIATRDEEKMSKIPVHSMDLQLKLRLLVLEACRYLIMEDALERSRQRRGKLPPPILALPAPEMIQ